MIHETLRELGYDLTKPPLVVMDRFHVASRAGDLIFTSGQPPRLAGEEIRGKVGDDVGLATAQHAAELCAVNCLRAINAVIDIESVDRIVKVLGLVNCAPGFNDTSLVINACSDLLGRVFGARGTMHARTAVGAVLPNNWAVEIEMVALLT